VARLPLLPRRSTIGGFALLLFLMTLMGTILLFSYTAAYWEPERQRALQAVAAGVLVILGGVAGYFFVFNREAR